MALVGQRLPRAGLTPKSIWQQKLDLIFFEREGTRSWVGNAIGQEEKCNLVLEEFGEEEVKTIEIYEIPK